MLLKLAMIAFEPRISGVIRYGFANGAIEDFSNELGIEPCTSLLLVYRNNSARQII